VERREFLGGAAVLGAATLAGTSVLGLAVPAATASSSSAPEATPVPSPDPAPEMMQDRMPAIPADKMTDAQKKAVAELTAGPRTGGLDGPFIPLLRSPEFMSRLQKTGAFLRFETNLGSVITEFIIILTARQWSQQYEFNSHQALALKAGIKPEIVTAIAEGRRPTGMSPDHEMVHDFCTELHINQSVSDATYAKVVARFTEKGVIEIAGLCGYYSLLGMVMNVARTPIPGATKMPLELFPH
jgi:4-carboxymuconolactone decarboxylase